MDRPEIRREESRYVLWRPGRRDRGGVPRDRLCDRDRGRGVHGLFKAPGERGTRLRDPRPDRTMKILVQTQKGGTYKLLFYDGKHTRGSAFVELTETPRGPRPTRYRVRWGAKK